MNHDWDMAAPEHDLGPATCRRCGITGVDMRAGWEAGRGWTPCTGNAYVCRVARKLLACYADSYGFPNNFIWVKPERFKGKPPWEADGDCLLELAWRIIERSGPINESIKALVRSADPTVCPILGDALEEAGCADSALLDALRTM